MLIEMSLGNVSKEISVAKCRDVNQRKNYKHIILGDGLMLLLLDMSCSILLPCVKNATIQ
jgi:hypothetical protein